MANASYTRFEGGLAGLNTVPFASTHSTGESGFTESLQSLNWYVSPGMSPVAFADSGTVCVTPPQLYGFRAPVRWKTPERPSSHQKSPRSPALVQRPLPFSVALVAVTFVAGSVLALAANRDHEHDGGQADDRDLPEHA